MRFFKGISVQTADTLGVMDGIRATGMAPLAGTGTDWRHPGPLDPLVGRDDLSRRMTRPLATTGPAATHACGDEDGAAHYAWRAAEQASGRKPVMIEYEAPPGHAAVDGNDILYTVFGRQGDPDRARPALRRLYGEAVLRYAEIAWSTSDVDRRMALCDLAIHDEEVVRAHHANAVLIGGRSDTLFRSAFVVRLPIPAGSIVRVWSPAVPPRPRGDRINFTSLLR